MFDYNEWIDTKIRRKFIRKGFFHPEISIPLEFLFLMLPHLVASLILILFYPQKWFGIILLGIIIPDLIYGIFAFYTRIHYLFFKKRNFFKKITLTLIRSLTHIALIITIIYMLIIKEYVIASSGILHMILDWIGF